MIDLVFWAPVMAGGALAGASSGVLGTFIVGMRIPFLGVCVAHAALAGAVFGGLCGLEDRRRRYLANALWGGDPHWLQYGTPPS